MKKENGDKRFMICPENVMNMLKNHSGKTKSGLADHCNISRQAMGEYLKRNCRAPVPVIEDMAKYLDCSPEYIIGLVSHKGMKLDGDYIALDLSDDHEPFNASYFVDKTYDDLAAALATDLADELAKTLIADEISMLVKDKMNPAFLRHIVGEYREKKHQEKEQINNTDSNLESQPQNKGLNSIKVDDTNIDEPKLLMTPFSYDSFNDKLAHDIAGLTPKRQQILLQVMRYLKNGNESILDTYLQITDLFFHKQPQIKEVIMRNGDFIYTHFRDENIPALLNHAYNLIYSTYDKAIENCNNNDKDFQNDIKQLLGYFTRDCKRKLERDMRGAILPYENTENDVMSLTYTETENILTYVAECILAKIKPNLISYKLEIPKDIVSKNGKESYLEFKNQVKKQIQSNLIRKVESCSNILLSALKEVTDNSESLLSQQE